MHRRCSIRTADNKQSVRIVRVSAQSLERSDSPKDKPAAGGRSHPSTGTIPKVEGKSLEEAPCTGDAPFEPPTINNRFVPSAAGASSLNCEAVQAEGQACSTGVAIVRVSAQSLERSDSPKDKPAAGGRSHPSTGTNEFEALFT